MDSTCEHCHRPYQVRESCEPTPLCDDCAHHAVAAHRAALRDCLTDMTALLRDGNYAEKMHSRLNLINSRINSALGEKATPHPTGCDCAACCPN